MRFLPLLLACPLWAQYVAVPFNSGASIPGPFNITVMDSSGCSNTTVPTNTLLGSSTFPSLPSGMSYTVTNTNTDLTCSSTQNYTWPTFSLTGGAWANTSTTSLQWSMNGSTGDSVRTTYPSSTVQPTVSRCTPFYTDASQTAASTARVDLWYHNTTNTLFMGEQFQWTGSAINVSTECGGTESGVGATSCVGGEGQNGTFPTGSWEIMCQIFTSGSAPTGYTGLWNTPQNGGTLVANSIVTSTPNFVSGATNQYGFLNGPENGSSGGVSGSHVWSGTSLFCGMTSAQSTCPFPIGPGLQFPTPAASPGSGNYTSAQTVTLSDYSPGVSIYYTTCASAGCAPATPTTASTLYSGTITATAPEAVSAIATLTGYVTSSAATFDYVSPNATYVGSGQANGTGSSQTITGLSIPSGDIIVCYNGNTSNGATGCSDSHSDTFSCSSIIADSSNGDLELCVAKAGATVTTVSCSQTFSGHTIYCMMAYYSPGTLTGVLDQYAGADNATSNAWSTGNTATLAGTSDLIVGGWLSCCSVTSSPTDGSTQRVTISGQTNQGGIQDRTGWGTAGTAATGSWNSSSGATVVVAIK